MASLDDSTIELFADDEGDLVPYLVPLSVAGCARAMAAWKSRVQPDGREPMEPERALHLSRTLDDRYALDGSLDAEGGATVAAAVRRAGADDTEPTVSRMLWTAPCTGY